MGLLDHELLHGMKASIWQSSLHFDACCFDFSNKEKVISTLGKSVCGLCIVHALIPKSSWMRGHSRNVIQIICLSAPDSLSFWKLVQSIYCYILSCWVLQCVEHMVHFKMKEKENEGDADENHCRINVRDFFVPTQVIGF